MTPITFQTGKNITVRFPVLYKYLEQEYIDEFFSGGKLRISSFKKFQSYDDEIRGDKNEGSGMVLRNENGSHVGVYAFSGLNEYLLSTSLILSDVLKEKFCKSYFQIHDPLAFSIAVSNALVGCIEAKMGFCDYLETRSIFRSDGVENTDPEKKATPTQEHFNKVMQDTRELMFVKSIEYQYQAEYRFVWSIDTRFFELYDHVDIICKEAIQYCTKI